MQSTPTAAIDLWLSPDAEFTAVPRPGYLSKIRVRSSAFELDLLFGSLMDPDDAGAVCRRLAGAATLLAEAYEQRACAVPVQREVSR